MGETLSVKLFVSLKWLPGIDFTQAGLVFLDALKEILINPKLYYSNCATVVLTLA